MSKINTNTSENTEVAKTTEADTGASTDIVKSTIDDLVQEDVSTFKGLFTAWERNVPTREDPSVKARKFKCVCTRTLRDGRKVDIAAWITEGAAKHFGIKNKSSFVGVFAYNEIVLASEAGQYNEERLLRNARLTSVLG